MFDINKIIPHSIHVRASKSSKVFMVCDHLASVVIACLWGHVSNMNMMEQILKDSFAAEMLLIEKINTRALVTTTSGKLDFKIVVRPRSPQHWYAALC